jgi:choline monooxygenase
MTAPQRQLRLSRLAPGLRERTSALPVSSYFEAAWLAREAECLFRPGPVYEGCTALVPEHGDFCTLAARDHSRALVHGAQGVQLVSNVCRHRQSLILEGRGKAHNLVCPLHRWTYDLGGQLLGAPGFEQAPAQCALPRTPLTEWQGLLFSGPVDVARLLADFPLPELFDFRGMVHTHTMVDRIDCNWKAFLEVYQELYHVDAIHPGLGHWVDLGSYELSFGEGWSCQAMASAPASRQGSARYERYQRASAAHTGGRVPDYGAVWATIYPNVMLEWYPHALIVSTAVPDGPERTRNVIEFYASEEVAAFEPELVTAQREAYLETAAEDAEACLRMHRGRRALWQDGRDERGPFHVPHEDAIVHFYDWMQARMR